MQKMKIFITRLLWFFFFLYSRCSDFCGGLSRPPTCAGAWLWLLSSWCACKYPYRCKAVFVNELADLDYCVSSCLGDAAWLHENPGSFTADLSRSRHSEMWLFQVSRLSPAAAVLAPLIYELRPPPGRLHGLRCSATSVKIEASGR